MMFLTDLFCLVCNHTWEALLIAKDEIRGCPECSSLNVVRVPGGKITKLNDPETKNAALKKRSQEHSVKEMRKRAGHKGHLPFDFKKE